jgi:hypothetical protein
MTMDDQDAVMNSFDHAERIGVIGSPSSSHSLVVDILGTAVDKKLVGSLCLFGFKQDGTDHFALGQITEIALRNVWSEDPTMRNLIRQKGRVDPITERQDTHTATMLVSSVFGKNQRGFEPSMLGTVPSTGTPIKLLNEQFMRDLLSQYSKELVYLGKAYGSNVLLPMWLKHFGQGPGGIGEAYHIGIFGKTGSGKSVLSKMVMMGYAKHKPMTIFVLDPQGEFAKIGDDARMLDVLEKIGKSPKIYSLHNLVLTGNQLFKKVLTLSGFLDELGIVHEDNKARAANQIDMIFQGRHPISTQQEIKPWEFYKREVFNLVWEALKTEQVLIHIYSSKDLQERVRSTIQSADIEYMYKRWKSVALLFTYQGKSESIEIKELSKTVTEQASGQIIIIDLSDVRVPQDTLWNDNVRMIVINEFLKSIESQAQTAYQQGKSLNTLVVIDEAHRLAPRDLKENEELERVRTTLKDAVRTTRKFGLGWMFISQTLSGLDREIINQLRIYVFGFGLAYGIELLGLREIIGGNDEAIRLYQLFKDPQSNPNQREYSFMTIGPISPLSFSGIPLFFQALPYPDIFVKENIDTFNATK